MFGQHLHLEVERETSLTVPQMTTRLTQGKKKRKKEKKVSWKREQSLSGLLNLPLGTLLP